MTAIRVCDSDEGAVDRTVLSKRTYRLDVMVLYAEMTLPHTVMVREKE